MTTQRTLVVALVWAMTAVGAVFMTLLAVSITEVEVSGPWLATFTALSAVVVAFASVGAILALRRPGNVVGVVLQASGPLLVTTFCGFLLGAWFTEVHGPDDALATVASVIASVTVSPTVILVGPALALLFPDGRLPGRRWRLPVAAIGFVLILGTIMMMTRPGPLNVGLANNPFGISGPAWVDPVSTLGLALTFLMVGAALLLAVLATAVRFRRGTGIEREQIKWFVAANTATVILLLVVTVDPALDITWFDAIALSSLALPPIAVGIAILRYRLYEIDRIICRTVSWAVVTGVARGRVRGARRRAPGRPRRRHPGPDAGRRGVHAGRLRAVPAGPTARPARRSTGASTGPATTRSARAPRSPSGSATRSTSTTLAEDLDATVRRRDRAAVESASGCASGRSMTRAAWRLAVAADRAADRGRRRGVRDRAGVRRPRADRRQPIGFGDFVTRRLRAPGADARVGRGHHCVAPPTTGQPDRLARC